jgi:hypothetical protein
MIQSLRQMPTKVVTKTTTLQRAMVLDIFIR